MAELMFQAKQLLRVEHCTNEILHQILQKFQNAFYHFWAANPKFSDVMLAACGCAVNCGKLKTDKISVWQV
jgi:hypothetical protein